jgi:hypothetical protein
VLNPSRDGRSSNNVKLEPMVLAPRRCRSVEGWRIETRRSPALNPLKQGPSGGIVRAGGALSAPVPLVLWTLSLISDEKRAKRLRRWAPMSTIAGSLLTRIGRIHAGHASAKDWRAPLEIAHPSEK